MFTAEELKAKREVLNEEVNQTLNSLISKSLGKRVLEDEDIEEHCEYLTFVDDMSGANVDFFFVGIDEGGSILACDDSGQFFEQGTLTLNNILLRSKIEIVEALENL